MMQRIHFESATKSCPDRASLAVTGPDASNFLQGLVTGRCRGLAPGKAGYAALLTPQGKILFDFLVLRHG